MKLFVFIVFALSFVVKANILAAAVRGIEPIVLTAGTLLAAIGLDIKSKSDIQLFEIAEYKEDP